MSDRSTGFEKHVSKGTVLFRQGDPGHEMFVVGRGRVRLTITEEGGLEKEVNVAVEGDFFGELSLLAEAPRSATATAVEDSTLLVVGRDVFGMMVQDDLEIVFRMMRAQGHRLSRTNVPLQQMMLQLGRVRVASHALRRALGQPLPVAIDVAALAAEATARPGPSRVSKTRVPWSRRSVGGASWCRVEAQLLRGLVRIARVTDEDVFQRRVDGVDRQDLDAAGDEVLAQLIHHHAAAGRGGE
jgi:CRP-like cAMP-binding protein